MEGLMRFDRRAWPRVPALVVMATSLAALSCSSDTGRHPRVRIAVGGQTQMVYLPTTLADALGFYAEEGVEVELQDFQGGAKALQALVGGSADVVSGFYDHTIQMAAEGRELVAFVTMLRYPGLVLVTSPQAAGRISTLADLAGGVAGVTTAGSSSHMFLTYLLTRQRVPIDSVSVTAIGAAATAIAAVERGKVDAGWMSDPAFTIVKQRNPRIRVLADLRDAPGTKAAFGTNAYPGAVFYASGDWLRANRDTAARLARAIVKTLKWMASHSEAEIAQRTPPALRGEGEALYAESLASSRPMFSTDGLMSAEGAAAVLTLLQESMPKVRDATIDLSRTYTNELVR
jgi:NitT/TauT family transport system substrate-binding protein